MGLQYHIDVLSALKEAGYSQAKLLREHMLSAGTLGKIRHGEPINWQMIETICSLLQCQPSDFLEWTPDD